jgi:hypothetical protein
VRRALADVRRRPGLALLLALLALPFAIASPPTHAPGLRSVLSLIVLGALGTALAFVIFYRLIAEVGAGRAALVTYLVPPLSLAYGALLLGETITAASVAGLLLRHRGHRQQHDQQGRQHGSQEIGSGRRPERDPGRGGRRGDHERQAHREGRERAMFGQAWMSASASISTFQRGSSRPATTTIVAAGRMSANTAWWARPTASWSSASTMNMRVRTTCSGPAPTSSSAATTISRHRAA